MKLEINTQERKIRLLEEVNIGELFTFLEEILPDLKWREYSIEGNVKVFDKNTPLYTPPYIPPHPYTTGRNPYEIKYDYISSTGETK